MTAFDEPYWNLAQAAVWIEFREKGLVEKFQHADHLKYRALHCYPSMWPDGRVEHSSLGDLHRALLSGKISAHGYHVSAPDRLVGIPAEHWHDLELRPPHAIDRRDSSRQKELWTDIRLKGADVRMFWRAPSEIELRTKFNWDAIKALHDQLRTENAEFSQNELITEIQGAFEDKFNTSAPSRSALQRHIKDWS